jgi:hypothetical protein
MKISAVTTMNQEYYDNIGYNLIKSFIKYWPKEVTLYVYTEDFKLPVQADNIVELDVYKQCNPGLQKFLDWRGKHFTRKFAYKAYTWINACKTIKADYLIYLDADTQTTREIPMRFFQTILPKDTLLTYMGAPGHTTKADGTREYRENAETSVYFFNLNHPYAGKFMKQYEDIYESRKIDNKEIYCKPHDTWVMVDCIRKARKNNVRIHNLHPEMEERSPMYRTMLRLCFRHWKGKSKHDKFNQGRFKEAS